MKVSDLIKRLSVCDLEKEVKVGGKPIKGLLITDEVVDLIGWEDFPKIGKSDF